MSMHEQYADDRDWMKALLQAVRDKKDFQDGKRHKDNNFLWLNTSGKRKRDEPTMANTAKKPLYAAKEKREYQAKKKDEKGDQGKEAPWQKNYASSLG